MAREVITLREGDITASNDNGVTVLEQQVVYQVKVDAPDEDRWDILENTNDLPKTNITKNARGMLCENVTLRAEAKNGLYYQATAKFSSGRISSGQSLPAGLITGDPVEWVPRARIEFEPIERIVQRDLDNKFYLNSAGDQFEHGLTMIDRIPVRVFTQYEPVDYVSTAWAASTTYRRGQVVSNAGRKWRCVTAGTSASSGGGPTAPFVGLYFIDGTAQWELLPPVVNGVTVDILEERCDTTNSHVFMGRAIDTLLLEVRSAEIGEYFGYNAWKIEYAMKYNKRTWIHKQWDMGYRYKEYDPSASADVKKPFIDPQTRAAYIGKLNGSGGKVADQINGDPAVLSFRIYDRLNFNTFIKAIA